MHDLNVFEKLNNTAPSIYNLGNFDVLIILRDGTNLTSWDDAENREDILFVSENLGSETDLKARYSGLTNAKAIITANVTDKVNSLERMFENCFRLVDIQAINWDTSNVTEMNGMFMECNSLRDISFLSDFNVSNVEDMSGMFQVCYSLGDISHLADWDVSNLKNTKNMFNDCHTLENIDALENWNMSNVLNMEGMFGNCNYLADISPLAHWDVLNVENMEFLFGGCDYLSDISPLANWDVSNVCNMNSIFKDTNVKDATALDSWIISDDSKIGLIFNGCNLIEKPCWYDKLI